MCVRERERERDCVREREREREREKERERETVCLPVSGPAVTVKAGYKCHVNLFTR